MRLLISTFALSDKYGSEESVAYRYLEQLHKSTLTEAYEEVIVFTSAEFLDQSLINKFSLFKFIPISTTKKIKSIYYDQGNWIFYLWYFLYSFKVFLASFNFKPYHSWQLNLVGYREPGLLYLFSKKHIWGPVSGIADLDIKFIKKSKKKESIKILINFFQKNFSPSVFLASRMSHSIFCVSSIDKKFFSEKSQKPKKVSYICEVAPRYLLKHDQDLRKKTVLWVGKDLPRKALWLAKEIASRCRETDFIFVGFDHESSQGSSNIKYIGRVSWEEMQSIYISSNILLITSIQEATSTVCTEAIEHGLHIISHDIGGIKNVTSNEISDLITVVSPEHSIDLMSRAIKEVDLSKLKGNYEKYESSVFPDIELAAQYKKIEDSLICSE